MGNRRTTHMGDGIDMNDKKGKQRDRALKLNAMNTVDNAQIEEMFDSTHPGDAKKANLDPSASAGISSNPNSKPNAKSSCAAGCTIF